MLDNLKLGYGGTKTEMERLVTDAEKLNKKFKATRDENGKLNASYADIVDAIHIVQQNMGITGTSAEEASTTIQGSMASVKAAWQDVLTAMGSGKDLDKKLDNFTQSVKKYAENMLPIVRQALKGAVKAIGQLAPQIAKELPKLVAELAPDVVKAGADIVTNLASGIYNQLAESNFDEQAKALTEKLNEMIDGIDAKAGGEKFANIINKAINAAFNIVTTFDAKEAARKLTDWFNSAVTKTDWNKLGQTVGNLRKGVWDFIGEALDNIDWVGVGNAISEFVNGIDWWGIIDSVFKVIGTVIKNAPDLLWSVIKNLDFENAAGMFALFFAPKMAGNLLSFFKNNAGTKATLTSAGTTMGNQIGGGLTGQGGGMATGLVGKISAGINTAATLAKAFAIGWTIGTYIKKGLDAIGWGQWIDDKINSLMEVVTAAERAKATENDIKAQNLEQLTKFKKLGFTHLTEQDIETGSQAYKKAYNIAGLLQKYPELAQAGYTATRILNDVSLYEDLMAGKLPTKVQEQKRYVASTSEQLAAYQYSNAYQQVSASMGYVPTSVLNQQAKIYLDTGKLVGGTGNTRAQQTNYTARGYAQ